MSFSEQRVDDDTSPGAVLPTGTGPVAPQLTSESRTQIDTHLPEALRRLRIVLAFAAVYVIWGSTYLGIKVAIESIPPFLMAGSRFLFAGVIMLAWLGARGDLGRFLRQPRALVLRQIAIAGIVGTLMLGTGNGIVVWAIEHGAPTGLVAVMIATTPFWLVLFQWIGDRRPVARRVLGGLVIGFAGIVVLRGLGGLGGGGAATRGLEGWTVPVILIATFSWALGSMLSKAGGAAPRRHAPIAPAEQPPPLSAEAARSAPALPVERSVVEPSRPRATSSDLSPLVSTGLQMLIGGAGLTIFSLATEPLSTFDPASISLRSGLGFVYLVIFGSLIAYTAFIWLLRQVSAAAVGTYAYVNPVVAVVLGGLFNAEPITPRTMLASGLILTAVILITLPRGRAKRAPAGPLTPPGRR